MLTRRRIIAAITAFVVLIVGGFFAVYFLFFQGSHVAPLTLSSATPSGTPIATSKIPGTWNIGGSSVVGYRVHEQLAFLSSPSDAVGRTSSITGNMTITESGTTLTVSAASFTADLTTLKSDSDMRDNRIRTIGLETDTYPNATFKLASPVALPANATSGSAFTVSLKGDLTIHGTTVNVTIPVQAKLEGGTIEVNGSLTFPFSEFGMQSPDVGGFVTIESQPTLEFDIFLTQ